MNILLLSNGAPNYHFFFNHLTQLFHEDGANITIAVDSPFSRSKNSLDSLGFPVYEFSSFFAKHATDQILLKKYARFNLNSALLSDFERAQVYGIWGRKDADYFDRLKSALLAFYEEIFARREISVVLYENVSNTFSHFAFFVAQELGIVYCGIGASRLPGRFSISSDPLCDREFERAFMQVQSGKLHVPENVYSWVEKYLSNIENIVPDYMQHNGLDKTNVLKRYLDFGRVAQIGKVVRHCRDDSYHSFQIGNPFVTHFNLFKRNLLRSIRLKGLARYYDSPVANEEYFLYPIHFHPESSTSILAGTYLNEYEVIRNIAFNLPEGVKLYVKDHISAWGYPAMEFYRKLKLLPNVRILSPVAPTKLLIKQSRAVITLTSTVGYEALLLGKAVLLFGSVFYEFHRNVKKIEDPSKIFGLLNNAPSLGENLKEYNMDFVAAYYLTTLEGSLNLMKAGKNAIDAAKMHYPRIRDAIVEKVTVQES